MWSFQKESSPPRTYMKIDSIPLLTEETFEGLPLRPILSPVTPDEPRNAMQVLDLFLGPLVNDVPEDEPINEVASAENLWNDPKEGRDMGRYLERGVDLNEQVARLLFALGNRPDSQMDIGPNRLMVTRDNVCFGVDDGVVVSRFSDGFKLKGFDPRPHLEQPKQLRLYDRSFACIYRDAYAKEADRALMALATGYPGYNFRKLGHLTKKPRKMPLAKVKRLEEAIMTVRDPCFTLYKQFVPDWMTRSQFSRVFGSVSKRPGSAKDIDRIGLVIKLHNYCLKPQKEE